MNLSRGGGLKLFKFSRGPEVGGMGFTYTWWGRGSAPVFPPPILRPLPTITKELLAINLKP